MSDPVRLRSGDPPNTSPEGTIDVIYDRLSGVAEAQFGDQTNLDGKMIQIFVAASVVMGFSGFTATSAAKNPAWVVTFLCLALAAYALVALATGLELWTAKFEALRFGSSLWDEEWMQPPDQVKLAVIDRVKAAYDSNLKILKEKGRLVSAGIVATGFEVLFVALAVIIRVAS